MLGIICSRPKPWISSLFSFTHGNNTCRFAGTPFSFVGKPNSNLQWRRRHHSSSCLLGGGGAPAASIWHAILPSGGFSDKTGRNLRRLRQKGVGGLREEGSWNVAWDVRPARWLHGSDSAWLLFGVCACFPGSAQRESGNVEGELSLDEVGVLVGDDALISKGENGFKDYRITGVPGDGRCLFRAVVHGVCLRSGKEAPDETLQRELADDLRAKVAEEFLKRREETEGFIDEDFDSYVRSIQQPYVWGGEPELMMASHVLQTSISVFMLDRSSGALVGIANYGQEYGKNESPIKVLFHGYGHYDALEIFSD